MGHRHLPFIAVALKVVAAGIFDHRRLIHQAAGEETRPFSSAGHWPGPSTLPADCEPPPRSQPDRHRCSCRWRRFASGILQPQHHGGHALELDFTLGELVLHLGDVLQILIERRPALSSDQAGPPRRWDHPTAAAVSCCWRSASADGRTGCVVGLQAAQHGVIDLCATDTHHAS